MAIIVVGGNICLQFDDILSFTSLCFNGLINAVNSKRVKTKQNISVSFQMIGVIFATVVLPGTEPSAGSVCVQCAHFSSRGGVGARVRVHNDEGHTHNFSEERFCKLVRNFERNRDREALIIFHRYTDDNSGAQHFQKRSTR